MGESLHCTRPLDYVPPEEPKAPRLETPLELGDPNCPGSRKLQTTFPSHNTHHALELDEATSVRGGAATKKASNVHCRFSRTRNACFACFLASLSLFSRCKQPISGYNIGASLPPFGAIPKRGSLYPKLKGPPTWRREL